MPRNTSFVPHHEPLLAHHFLSMQHARTTGPFSFLNPTRAHFQHHSLNPNRQHPDPATAPAQPSTTVSSADTEKPSSGTEVPASSIAFQWTSRNNRKGRHALVITPSSSPNAPYLAPPSTSSLTATLTGLRRMATVYPYWDISYLVALLFTLGSVVWVLNAFFVWLPLVRPESEFATEILYAGGITAFIGATVFEAGSVLLMFEAVNENRAGCFGWALEKAVEGRIRVRPDVGGCAHHHSNRHNFVGRGDVKRGEETGGGEGSEASLEKEQEGEGEGEEQVAEKGAAFVPVEQEKQWRWFPSGKELTTHYLREIGFLASLAQFYGASVFWISGFTALPGINDVIASQGLLDGIYWAPQIVGGSGFIVSGLLFMLETQPKWYVPAPKSLGWHIGLWNLIGALGFTLCGALGPAYDNSGAQYEASLATFWGSWAFLIGSVIQWYECLDTHPVEEKKKKQDS